jgi:lipopolysaccharide biosynthesis glycosyltransferase
MESNTVHIVLASDLEGADGLAVTVFSALKSSSRPIHVWVIEERIPASVQARLMQVWRQCDNLTETTFIPMSSLPLAMPAFWARAGWPLTSAARFQIGDLLPVEVHRCIYLDIDILIGVELGELFDLDLQGLPLGMVLNGRLEGKVRNYLRSIDLDPDMYGNAGVLLMDLDAWRSEGANRKLIDTGLALPSNIWFFDQDMLNTYFKNRFLVLEDRWNFRDAGVLPDGKIQHFAGPAKPWKLAAQDASLPGHVAWHEAKRRSGYATEQIPLYAKWRKRVGVVVSKVRRRLVAA